MPRQGLDRPAIFKAALELADRDGLESLTMRSLGRELGVEAPSLYKHVHGKEDIFDGIADLVYSEVSIDSSDDPWQERVKHHVASLRKSMLAHPNIAPLLATRSIVSQTTMCLIEDGLTELSRVGLSPKKAVYTLDALVSFVVGHVLAELSNHPAAGSSPEALAEIRAMLSEAEFPQVRATLGAGPVDRDLEFEFGVQLLVDGLERQIQPC